MISKFKKTEWTSTVLTLTIILLVGLIGLTGCKKSTSENNSNNASPTNSAANSVITPAVTTAPTPVVTNAPANSADGQGNTSGSSTDQNSNTASPVPTQTALNPLDKDFYGNYVIKQVIAYGAAGTYSKEAAEGLVGRNMTFTKDFATCFGDDPSYIDKVVQKPVYVRNTVASKDFASEFRINLDKLGITADTVTEVIAADAKGNGSTFFIKDDNNLIVYGGGTFFELERKTE